MLKHSPKEKNCKMSDEVSVAGHKNVEKNTRGKIVCLNKYSKKLNFFFTFSTYQFF